MNNTKQCDCCGIQAGKIMKLQKRVWSEPTLEDLNNVEQKVNSLKYTFREALNFYDLFQVVLYKYYVNDNIDDMDTANIKFWCAKCKYKILTYVDEKYKVKTKQRRKAPIKSFNQLDLFNDINMHKILSVFALLFFLSCNKLTEGKVIYKRFEPRTEYLYYMPVTMSNGKNTYTNLVPYWIIDDEDYIVTIENYYKGELIQEDIYTTQKNWECLQNGDHLQIDSTCSNEDNNNEKIRR